MENFMIWFKAAGIRAVKTVAQTAVALIPAGVMLEAVDWKVIISTAVLAGIVSMLTSIAGLPEVNVTDHKEGTDGSED